MNGRRRIEGAVQAVPCAASMCADRNIPCGRATANDSLVTVRNVQVDPRCSSRRIVVGSVHDVDARRRTERRPLDAQAVRSGGERGCVDGNAHGRVRLHRVVGKQGNTVPQGVMQHSVREPLLMYSSASSGLTVMPFTV